MKIRPKKEVALEYIFVFLYIAVLLIFLFLTTPLLLPDNPLFVVLTDHQYYIRMAENPFSSVPAPFAYRILTPLLAWLLPFDLITSFLIIDIMSLLLSGIILYYLFKQKFSSLISLSGVTIFFSLEFGPRYQVFNFWLVDSLTFLFIILCFWSIHHEKYRTYSIFLVIGVLVKEVMLFTIPVFVIMYFSNKRTTTPLKTIGYILPAILVFAILRLVVPIDASVPYDFFSSATDLFFSRASRFDSELYRYTITTWGLFLMVLPFFNERKWIKEWLTYYGLFLVLVYLQLLFAENIERLLVLGFVPIIILSLKGLTTFGKNRIEIEIWFFVTAISYFFYRLLSNIPFDSKDPFANQLLFCGPVFLILVIIRKFTHKEDLETQTSQNERDKTIAEDSLSKLE